MNRKLVQIYVYQLRNESYVQFHEDFIQIVEKIGAGDIGIKTLFDAYKPRFAEVIAILDYILKSDITARLEEQDSARDDLYRGLVTAVDAYLHHFDAAKRAAATKLKLVIDHYGNIATRNYNEGSAAIDDLLRELALPANAPLVTLLSLGDWIEQLASANARFFELMHERYDEQSKRPLTTMKAARSAVDDLFHAMIDRVEAIPLYRPRLVVVVVESVRHRPRGAGEEYPGNK
jgi:hypothetical protein